MSKLLPRMPMAAIALLSIVPKKAPPKRAWCGLVELKWCQYG
jgi:hypothetical protein